MSYNRNNPDFDQWAIKLNTISEIAAALEQAYDQGYYASEIDKDQNWWKQQDKEMLDKESNND